MTANRGTPVDLTKVDLEDPNYALERGHSSQQSDTIPATPSSQKALRRTTLSSQGGGGPRDVGMGMHMIPEDQSAGTLPKNKNIRSPDDLEDYDEVDDEDFFDLTFFSEELTEFIEFWNVCHSPLPPLPLCPRNTQNVECSAYGASTDSRPHACP